MAALEATFYTHGYTEGYILHSWLHSRLNFTVLATLRARFYTHGCTHGYILTHMATWLAPGYIARANARVENLVLAFNDTHGYILH